MRWVEHGLLLLLLFASASSNAQSTEPNPAARYPKSSNSSTQQQTTPENTQAASNLKEPVPIGSTSLSAKEVSLQKIAEKFAPVIYQRMAGSADEHRFDFPTNFDFDGDWTGNNNWDHAADTKYKAFSHVYYSVIESEDHWFVYYALYHMRDWSTVDKDYQSVLDRIQEKYKDILDDDLRKQVQFNHENDLEGILVIIEKNSRHAGGGQVIAIETVAHDFMQRAVDDRLSDVMQSFPRKMKHILLETENGHPAVYVESQKHGIHPYTGEKSESKLPIIIMKIGTSVDFAKISGSETTYDLIPLRTTIWNRARGSQEPNLMFGTVIDFGSDFCAIRGARHPQCEFGTVGEAFFGQHDRQNAALTPWGWGDNYDRSLKPGVWFFDPLTILRTHFLQDVGDERYVYHPYLGIGEDSPGSDASSTPRSRR